MRLTRLEFGICVSVLMALISYAEGHYYFTIAFCLAGSTAIAIDDIRKGHSR